MLTDTDRLALLRVAREAIAASVLRREAPVSPSGDALRRLAGAFVTLKAHGELRGCIGYPAGDQPLGDVVSRCAVAASTADPRFPPVDPRDLDAIRLEISVLGPIEPLTDWLRLEIGRHGVIVEEGMRRGLLLPQVATEWQWDRETFLAHTCLKAGLPPDAWKHGARLYTFEAEVFGE